MFLDAIWMSLVAGAVGTGIGGLLSILIKKNSKALTGLMFNFASGVMLGIVFFDLIPEAIDIGNILMVCLGIAVGTSFVFFVNSRVDKKLKLKSNIEDGHSTKMFKMGMIIFFSITMHNLPEGLIIGSGTLIERGLLATILIGVHNIPEGMAMAFPLLGGGYSKIKTVLLCVASGLPTAIGSLLGFAFGNISNLIICFCISLAAGAMMCIVFSEMIPEAHEMIGEGNKRGTIGLIVGCILALILTRVIHG